MFAVKIVLFAVGHERAVAVDVLDDVDEVVVTVVVVVGKSFIAPHMPVFEPPGRLMALCRKHVPVEPGMVVYSHEIA